MVEQGTVSANDINENEVINQLEILYLFFSFFKTSRNTANLL